MSFDLGKLVPKEMLSKLYDDAFSPAAKQVGKFGEDAFKTARLLLAPLQVTALAQDRFAAMIERMSHKIPEQRRIEAPPEIVGPVLERLAYLDDTNPLSAMFEEVLTKAIDKDGQSRVHPAFPILISQLSHDEGWMLYRLKDRNFKITDYLEYDAKQNRFDNRKIEHTELPNSELYNPTGIELYFAHLQSLGLVEWPVLSQEPIMEDRKQVGVRRYSEMRLTEFGRLFVEAVIPPEGFERFSKMPPINL
jgi:hypothetical protein